VAATWIKNAVKNGTKLILADPRRSELARHATHYLQFKPDTDVALLNAMMHTIVEEGLATARSSPIARAATRRSGANVASYSPRRWRRSAAFRRDDPRGRAALRARRRLDDPVGHGHLAARATAPTTRAA
jgi:anaerobic selenocysteine-containing dehydrogenase